MILITGLGPGDIARIPGPVLDILLDPSRTVIARTINHPAAAQLGEKRQVTFCDDIYEKEHTFESVYSAIADRVLAAAKEGPVVYAVPGGPGMGEFAVRQIVARGEDVEILNTETFVDAILAEVGYDPFERGLQILNGHELPFPLIVDKPTIVGHLDRPEVLSDVAANLSRVVPEDAIIGLFSGLGAEGAVSWSGMIDDIDPSLAGYRTSIWIDVEPGGLVGAIRTMQRLRRECPWDREQTHESLTKHLVEEAYELIEAVAGLEPGDMVAYARVEEEIGDVLLQVLFQAAIGSESDAFDIDDVAEVLRQKLVRRHPHVFGDVEVADAAEVKSNWDAIKREEKGGGFKEPFEGIPPGMPALHRASKVQNRASKAGLAVGERSLRDVAESLASLESSGLGEGEEMVGQILFDLVDYTRRAGLDAETALRRATTRFESDVNSIEPGIQA
jgi:tetrapyrrole methylase family protein / MazG family protein